MAARPSSISASLGFLVAAILVIVTGLVIVTIFVTSPGGELVPVGSLPATPEGSRVMLAVGDIGHCDGQADDAVAELARALPGQVAILGDIAYPDGSAQDFADCFDPAWGAIKDRLRPVPGNHEYDTNGAAAYFDYFADAAGRADEGWYSFDHGDWHVVALNTNCSETGGCGPDSPQLAWLRADLRDNPAECTVALMHHPRFSTGRHGDTDAVDPLWDALAAAGADLVLAGHDHSYERLRGDGMRSFVVGTGGRSLYQFFRPPSSRTEERQDSSYGLLWLALGDGSYEWRFISVSAGGYTDTGRATCH
jgi:alkaline phosphatase